MFRKSSKQKKQHNKRRRQTKKIRQTIRGAGLPGIFKWATSNIMGDTLFGKSIYTIRKENFIARPNINTFYNIINELYQVYFSLSKVEKSSTKIIVEQCWKLINKVFQHNEDPVIQKIISNTGINNTEINNTEINKTEFEHVLHLIQEEYNNNKTDYSPESVSNLIDDQVKKPSSGSTTSTITSTTISPTTSTTSSTTQPMPSYNVSKSISNMLLPTKQPKPHKYMKYFQDIKYIPYEFEDENKLKYVGEGVYGKVFKAIQKKTGETYALKSILNATQEHMEEIKNELKILEAVEQNCKKRDDGTMGFIVCFTGITFNNEKIYIVNEFLTDYIELFDFVYKKKKKRGDKIDKQALPVIIDKICRGLLSIHELGVAHRDIKLENIMININYKNPDFMNIKYIDFGFSTKVDSDGNYDVGRRLDNYTPLGTPLYLDPLYIKAIKKPHLNIDILKNSDYYAIGIVIFELISSFMEIDRKYKNDSTPLNILDIDLNYFLVGDELTISSYNRGLNGNLLLTKIINESKKIGETAKTAKLYYPDIIKLISLIPNRKEGIIPPQ
jgi:hypothetical protein